MQSKMLVAENKNFYASLSVLRISLGIVYLWFGGLKYFQGISPAEKLAMQTIHRLTFGLINDHANIIMLATWECLIGVLFISGRFVKPSLVLMLLHMVCTFTPFIFFPAETFRCIVLRRVDISERPASPASPVATIHPATLSSSRSWI